MSNDNKPAAAQEAVVTYCGRRLTPGGTRECWGYLSEGVEDLPRGTKLYAAPVAAAPAWVVANGQGDKWRKWGDFGPEWTEDRNAALHFARRSDAEAFSAEDIDAWLIQPVGTPAAPGIDLAALHSFICELEAEANDAATSDNVLCQKSANIKRRIIAHLRTLIDASPKGGSTGPIIPEPHQECYSDNDGDSWYDHPADSMLVDGLAVGDTYTLSVSHYSVGRTYRVTKAPDETSDDYEVEPVQATSAEVGA